MIAIRHPAFPFVVCAALCFVCVHDVRQVPTGKMEAYFLDIGQGDATLIIGPGGRRVLIDGGPDAAVLGQLSPHIPFFDRSIDLVVSTHPDSDHSGGLAAVLDRYDVGAVLMAGVIHDSSPYEGLLDRIKRDHVPIIVPDPSRNIVFDDGLTLDIFWPDENLFGKEVEDTNGTAVVLTASANGRSVLMTADVEAPGEEAILRSGADITADVLKVAHHGSKTSSGTGFLLATHPTRAFISAAKFNKYGHPSPSVMDRFRAMAIPTHVTAFEGEGRY